ncbi:hypothetical protein [Aeoliella sp. SH292]|uniref:hypothetical protein n=1 Tax=Aeoliella sp. SH292 TaxID=3454464 RepID=UPI003F9BFEE2
MNSMPPAIGGVILGGAASESGTLEIRSGGNLVVDPSGGSGVTGDVRVGVTGTGALSVQSGGMLSVTRDLTIGGGVSGSLAYANGADITVGRNLSIAASGTFAPQFSASTHTPIVVDGTVSLGGTLAPDFGSYTPSAGDNWVLFDTTNFSGAFASVNSPTVPSGLKYVLTSRAGGTNGTLVELRLEQLLKLTVDLQSGELKIVNGNGAAVEIDGYSIRSGSEVFNASNSGWRSFQDNLVAGWQESNPKPTQLNETNPHGSSSIGMNTSISLGEAYIPVVPTQIGQLPLEDLVFEYKRPDGRTFAGEVEFVGKRNTVVLTVDPVTGEAAFQNESSFSAAIDGYTIASASGSLRTGNGQWNSLSDQGTDAGNWEEANSSAGRLTELNKDSSSLLNSGTIFNLGSLFDINGNQDLSFQFKLAGQLTPIDGIVVYGALPVVENLPGDFNGDNVVNLADYTVWRDNLGAVDESAISFNGNGGGVTAEDYQVWKSNFGQSASAAALSAQTQAVPEPAAWWAGSIAMLALLRTVRHRGRS